MKLPLILLAALFLPATQAADEEADPQRLAEARKRCTAIDGTVARDCVPLMLEALDYPDDYMRGRATARALQALRQVNAPLEAARQAKIDAEQAAATSRRRAQQQAATDAAREEKRKACAAKGITLGQVKLKMNVGEVAECGWGMPVDTSKVTDSEGVREIWVYSARRSLVFKDGRLASIRE